MHPFKVLIAEDKVKERVSKMGAEISKYYQDRKTKKLVVIGVLKGSFVFLADLVRSLNVPCEIEFVEVSSYGAGTMSSGDIQLLRDIAVPLEGQDVLVVEDIIDTGRTIYYLLEHLRKSHRPHSIAVAALLYKPSRSVNQIKPDFLGFTIEDKFVIGYGLDFNNRFREIPDVAIYEEGKVSIDL